MSQCDAVLSNVPGSILSVIKPPSECHFDHHLILRDLRVKMRKLQRSEAEQAIIIPDANMSEQMLQDMLLQPAWPRRPSNVIAF